MAVGRSNAVQETLGLTNLKGKVIRHENAVDHRDFDIEMYKDIKEMSPYISFVHPDCVNPQIV